MAKFRRKPLVIEAEQWWPHTTVDGVVWPPNAECRIHGFENGLAGPHIHTLEGPLKVSGGDWIITGAQSERYPCKPDIFEATYEAVTE